MIIDLNKLNALEHNIYDKLILYTKENQSLKITKAAELCGCSTSKISKFVKKLGFENFKQFVNFTQGEDPPQKEISNELERIRNFTEEFDSKMVDAFVSLLDSHAKIILFGYGPSYHCAQYFEYKLRIHCDKFIVAIPDVITAISQVDSNTLLVVFSATGRFASFKEICDEAKRKNGDILLIVEEYHPELLNDYENIFFLTHSTQSSELAPYEKSRIVFYIFIEEVIFKLLERNKNKIEESPT